jgi:Flp pilus assembly protein TadD
MMIAFRAKAATTSAALLLIFSTLACSRIENAPSSATGSANNTSAEVGSNISSNAGAIGTKKYDAEIARLEKEVEKSPGDDTVRTTLAKAYLGRGSILAAAHQNKAALADFRSALQLDPDNEEAQQKTAAMRKEIGNDPSEDEGEPVGLPPSPDALDEDDNSSGETATPTHRNKKGETKKAG